MVAGVLDREGAEGAACNELQVEALPTIFFFGFDKIWQACSWL